MPMIPDTDCSNQRAKELSNTSNGERVVMLNDMGCNAIKAGHYDSSTNYFERAIYVLQQGLKDATEHNITLDDEADSQAAHYYRLDEPLPILSPSHIIADEEVRPNATAAPATTTTIKSSITFRHHDLPIGIYKEPRRITALSYTGSSHCCYSHSDFDELTSVLIFNLALSHHLSSFVIIGAQQHHNQQPDRVRLSQALRSYELVYKLHMDEEHNHSLHPFYTMAVLNNVAHVHSSLHDEQRSNKCAEALLSSIIWLGSYYDDEESSSSSSELFSFFFGTIKHLILVDPFTALAA